MKLYYIRNNYSNEIIAISEEKSYICRFFYQNGYEFRDYTIFQTTKKKKIRKIQDKYFDFNLESYKGYMIRYEDVKILGNMIDEYQEMMKDTIYNLSDMIENCNLKSEDKEAFYHVIKLLKKNKKNKNIEGFIKIDQFIRDYYNIDQYRNELLNNYNDFKFKIYKED